MHRRNILANSSFAFLVDSGYFFNESENKNCLDISKPVLKITVDFLSHPSFICEVHNIMK